MTQLLVARVLPPDRRLSSIAKYQLRLVAACCCGCAGCKGCAGCAGCAFGAAFGAALGCCCCCAEAVFASSVAAKVTTMVAVNARPHGRTDTVR